MNSGLANLNYFFKDFFDKELNMKSFESIFMLQILIYILKFYGVQFKYDFTWWKNGPYSPRLEDDGYATSKKRTALSSDQIKIVSKVKKGKQILKDSSKAELVASYLYLIDRLRNINSNEIEKELVTRKPYLSSGQVQQTMEEWNRIVNLPLTTAPRHLPS